MSISGLVPIVKMYLQILPSFIMLVIICNDSPSHAISAFNISQHIIPNAKTSMPLSLSVAD
jgi:hypothetical protein